MFWTTQHSFKPSLPSILSKIYFPSASFVNVYPFVLIMFFKLCVFLIFTASDRQTFNTTFNVIYGCGYVFVTLLLVVTQRPHRVPIPFNYLAMAKLCAGYYFYLCDIYNCVLLIETLLYSAVTNMYRFLSIDD